ncbi:Cytoplasmic dynein 2 light intermediate chain 1 [Trichoplax sp. H2]|nr:Cytoplasmic dynein 2 light intermediate chain 1 [Trichoplax sp. H2]|eukprot:RDD39755.1 Cytoplasmic dynein 2 light intermediate chain 1 [Trichoplax sp. H2]
MGEKSEKSLWDIAILERNRAEQENKELIDGNNVGSDGTNVFFLGSKNSGKSSIIMRFLDRDENPKPTVALEYLFGRRARGANTVKDVTHIWELGGGTFLTKLIDTVITPRTISIHEFLKQQLNRRINEDHPDKSLMEPLLVPLVIVGSKYDIYQDFDPEKRKIISKTLRFIAHTYGATLQFFSTKNESLVARARQLIGNLAFHFPPSKTNATDHNKPIIVPAGTDLFSQIGAPPLSDEQLGKISARRPMDLWKSAFCQYFPQEASTNSNTNKNPAADSQYTESPIDNMRIQKDKELEQYRRQSERKAKERKMAREADVVTSTRGGHYPDKEDHFFGQIMLRYVQDRTLIIVIA